MHARFGTLILQNLSKKIQCAQNKSVWFCLNLDNRAHLDKKEFITMNWLATNERVNQCICTYFAWPNSLKSTLKSIKGQGYLFFKVYPGRVQPRPCPKTKQQWVKIRLSSNIVIVPFSCKF